MNRILVALLLLAAASLATAGELLDVEADVPDRVWAGTVLPAECLFRHAAGSEMLRVTAGATLTFSDGTSIAGFGPETSDLAPGNGWIVAAMVAVPADAPPGPALWTCHATSTLLVEGEPTGESATDAASAATTIRGSARPRG